MIGQSAAVPSSHFIFFLFTFPLCAVITKLFSSSCSRLPGSAATVRVRRRRPQPRRPRFPAPMSSSDTDTIETQPRSSRLRFEFCVLIDVLWWYVVLSFEWGIVWYGYLFEKMEIPFKDFVSSIFESRLEARKDGNTKIKTDIDVLELYKYLDGKRVVHVYVEPNVAAILGGIETSTDGMVRRSLRNHENSSSLGSVRIVKNSSRLRQDKTDNDDDEEFDSNVDKEGQGNLAVYKPNDVDMFDNIEGLDVDYEDMDEYQGREGLKKLDGGEPDEPNHTKLGKKRVKMTFHGYGREGHNKRGCKHKSEWESFAAKRRTAKEKVPQVIQNKKNYGAMKCVDRIKEAVFRNQMETLNIILVSINRTMYLLKSSVVSTLPKLALRSRYPSLRVAYVEEKELIVADKVQKVYSSVLVKAVNHFDQETYRVKLPGQPNTGKGKPENQNHAIIFTRGEALQTIDMNQDNYFEEAFKVRNVLQEFLQHRGKRHPTILGMREHIFTGRLDATHDIQQWSHVPNSVLRRGYILYHEYMQVGKGRDVGLNQISKFETKVANGNSEQRSNSATWKSMVDAVKVFILHLQLKAYIIQGYPHEDLQINLRKNSMSSPRTSRASDASSASFGSEVPLGNGVPCKISFPGNTCLIWQPKIEDDHPSWLHLRVREFNPHHKDKTIHLNGNNEEPEGRWTLGFSNAEACEAACVLISEETSKQRHEARSELAQIVDV
ncbi:hypothetical protein Droror1_Dr00023897 [Drosera rotundifolia]